MNKKTYRYLTIAMFVMALLALFAASPLQALPAAASAFQTTPGPVEPTIVVIPDTGGDTQTTNVFIDSWLIWVILGAVLLVLVVALLMRGSTPPHHHD